MATRSSSAISTRIVGRMLHPRNVQSVGPATIVGNPDRKRGGRSVDCGQAHLNVFQTDTAPFGRTLRDRAGIAIFDSEPKLVIQFARGDANRDMLLCWSHCVLDGVF